MKKGYLCSAMIVLSLICALLGGCSHSQTNMASAVESAASVSSSNTGSVGIEETPPVQTLLSSEVFDETVTNLYSVSADTLLVIKPEELVLYNTQTETVLAQQSIREDDHFDWHVFKSGLCGIKTIYEGNKVAGNYAVFWDQNLTETRQIDLDTLTSDAEMFQWVIAADGTQLVWADVFENKLYLYNCATETKTELLDYNDQNAQNNQGITGISQVFFDEDGNRLIFLANSNSQDGDDNGVVTWGTLNLDGSELSNHYFNEFTAGGEALFQNGFLLCKEDPFTSVGNICILEVNIGLENIYPLKNIKEKEHLSYFSQGGNYYATLFTEKDDTVEVRLYAAQDGTLIGEYPVESDSAVVCILDSLNTLYIKSGRVGAYPAEVTQITF